MISGIELVSQLIKGHYVDYERLIPRSYATRTILNREELLKACKTASIFVRSETNDVYLDLEPGGGSVTGRIRLSATSTAIGDNADEQPARVDGESVAISFDVRFLIDVLSVIDDTHIALETTGPTRFAAIRPLGSGDFLHILAPMVSTQF